jgi:SAM-dependent methyltransferase
VNELSKSIPRRQRDPAFLAHYFVGIGLDVGCGQDHLALYDEQFPLLQKVAPYDVIYGHQDAQTLPEVSDETFDFVHASHVLEHVPDPAAALATWLRVVKPGGYVVVLIPDEDLYEQGLWPSQKNPDHKRTFTPWKASSWSPVSVNVVDLVRGLAEAELLKLELLTSSFNFRWPPIDQTLTPIGECAIEFVLRKRPASEIKAGGRLPQPEGV